VSVRGRDGSPRRLIVVAVVAVTASMALSACKEVEQEAAKGYTPAKLEPIKGSDDLQRVTFTAEGARRVGLQTAPARRSGRYEVVPYAALVYDAEGKTFVYKVTGPLSFERERVRVDRIVGRRAFLTRGPVTGTRVVTVGAAEVYGAELDVAGSH
jgi:hypothetical protein